MNDHDFKLSMLLQSSVLIDEIDQETTKMSNSNFEIFLKKNNAVLIIDKRNPLRKVFYNDINVAYSKVIGN